jgi:hypothetical protein
MLKVNSVQGRMPKFPAPQQHPQVQQHIPQQPN